jgi:hypothetical protein
LAQQGVQERSKKDFKETEITIPHCDLGDLLGKVRIGYLSPLKMTRLAVNLKEHLEAMKAKLTTLADQDLKDQLTGKLSELADQDVKEQLTLRLNSLIQSADLLFNIGQYYKHLISVAIAVDH